ncbi:MAG: iron-sulfur cluster assembly scaffold protein [Spirochaetes bacterium]|nr:MAG: iron-sulfur cluster assembly scaffold protein [Spirochaetota bacterium]
MTKKLDWVYSDIVKDHFMNPRNILEDEESYQADGEGLAGNIKCGDQMLMVIKVEDGRITDCKWKTYGCASAIASTSMLSEAVKGMTLEEAYHVSPRDIAQKLGGLPEHKIHCSVLGDKALRAAIEDYYEKQGMEDKIERRKDRIVCSCMEVTEGEIENAIMEGVKTYEELQEHTKIGTVCGECKDETLELMEKYLKKYSN